MRHGRLLWNPFGVPLTLLIKPRVRCATLGYGILLLRGRLIDDYFASAACAAANLAIGTRNGLQLT